MRRAKIAGEKAVIVFWLTQQTSLFHVVIKHGRFLNLKSAYYAASRNGILAVGSDAGDSQKTTVSESRVLLFLARQIPSLQPSLAAAFHFEFAG